MPGAQSQGRAAFMQPLGTSKNKKGHHLNTPPLRETSRAQHCQATRYSWAMENMTAQELLAAYAAGERNFSGADLFRANLSGANLRGANGLSVCQRAAGAENIYSNNNIKLL
jgi:hypothetical protein